MKKATSFADIVGRTRQLGQPSVSIHAGINEFISTHLHRRYSESVDVSAGSMSRLLGPRTFLALYAAFSSS